MFYNVDKNIVQLYSSTTIVSIVIKGIVYVKSIINFKIEYDGEKCCYYSGSLVNI